MGAVGADSEHVRPSAHQQHRLIRHAASEFRAIGELGERDPLRQIGAAWTCLIFGHSTLLQLPVVFVFGRQAATRALARFEHQRDGRKADHLNLSPRVPPATAVVRSESGTPIHVSANIDDGRRAVLRRERVRNLRGAMATAPATHVTHQVTEGPGGRYRVMNNRCSQARLYTVIYVQVARI